MHVNIPYMDPVAWVILKIVVHKLDIALRQLNNNDKAPPRRPYRKKIWHPVEKKHKQECFFVWKKFMGTKIDYVDMPFCRHGMTWGEFMISNGTSLMIFYPSLLDGFFVCKVFEPPSWDGRNIPKYTSQSGTSWRWETTYFIPQKGSWQM